MDHARRYETQQKKDLTRPMTRSSPTTTHSARMSRAYKSSAESPFSRRNEHSFRKPTSTVGYRTPPFSFRSRLNQRSAVKKQISHAEWRKVENMKKEIVERQDVTKRRVQKKHTHRVSSPPFEKPATSGSITSQTFPSNDKDKTGRNKDQSKAEKIRPVEQPSPVNPAIARSIAIQQKRKEIEEIYQRDCGTFSMVVRKLVSKDPSLVSPIRFSVQENLKEIGLRCAAAMDQFITQYDLRDVSQ
ncbi:unnamed protein product [Lota lota]